MGVNWGGYPRISEDPKDLRTGITRQIEDIKSAIATAGGEASTIQWYTENDTSAYRQRRVIKRDALGNDYAAWRVVRPIWQQALADLRAGKIDALMVWDLDRLARDPRDLEDAIEVVTRYGKRISSTAGSIDLTSDGGIAMARVMVAMGNKSSADTGRRVKRAHRALAEAGKPVGGARPFGWLEDKSTLHPVEAELVRGAAAALLMGESLGHIVNSWNGLGVTSTRGNPFTHFTLLQMLRSPRLCGWRTHKGEVVLKDNAPVRGLWEPIMDQDMYDALQVIVGKRPESRRRTPRRDQRHYLLTGTLRCGICNRRMYGSKRSVGGDLGRFDYSCSSQRATDHRLSGTGLLIDAVVRGWMYLKLSEGPLDATAEGTWTDNGRLAEINSMIHEAMAELRTKRLSSAVVFAHVGELESERRALEMERDRALAQCFRQSPDDVTADEFLDLTDDAARKYIAKYLEAVILQPAVGRSRHFDETRLVPVWREVGQPQLATLG